MEVEGAFSGCFPDFTDKPSADQEPSLQKPLSRAAGEDDGAGAAKAGFECNVCLGLAADPVVTSCGHLYCWPCIYRWSHHEATPKSSPLCPVCKSPFSESSLIPLYGCGIDAKSRCGNHDIPDRPKDHRKLVAAANTISDDDRRRTYPFYGGSHGRSSAASLSPLAMLPWLSPNRLDFFTGSYQSSAMALAAAERGGRESMRRRGMHELRVEIWLHQFGEYHE
ncbi:E3 ubiquitin-protein ligase RMA1H1 [Platanthera guangdongensis]|uniref:E3 ubiquitin-protein ligase RMA n=1 Tax=Platanthera guangdongensis TaxID=2320717 RepID=A0ABR2LP08_9ASPA